MKRYAGVVLLICTCSWVVMMVGCEDEGDMLPLVDTPTPVSTAQPTATPITTTLAEIQYLIFTPSCALSRCHAAPGQAGLILEAGSAHSNLVNVPAQNSPGTRVIPGNADDSVLIGRLEGTVNTIMPPTGALPQNGIDMIREWIDAGARDN